MLSEFSSQQFCIIRLYKSQSEEYVTRLSFIKFWPIKNIFRKLSQSDFLWTKLPRKIVFCLKRSIFWQNKYSNLNDSCYFKPELILWTKLPWNLLLMKYLISFPAALILNVVNAIKTKLWFEMILTYIIFALHKIWSFLSRISSFFVQCWFAHFCKVVPLTIFVLWIMFAIVVK